MKPKSLFNWNEYNLLKIDQNQSTAVVDRTKYQKKKKKKFPPVSLAASIVSCLPFIFCRVLRLSQRQKASERERESILRRQPCVEYWRSLVALTTLRPSAPVSSNCLGGYFCFLFLCKFS